MRYNTAYAAYGISGGCAPYSIHTGDPRRKYGSRPANHFHA
jgi:hypothetical protein